MAKLSAVREALRKSPHYESGRDRFEVYTQIAQVVRQMRQDCGLSQRAMSDATGLDQAEISRIENGVGERVPGVTTLTNIAAAAGRYVVLTYATKEQVAEILARRQSGDDLFRYSIVVDRS